MNATVKEVRNDCVEIAWEPAEGAEKYHVYWADKNISTMKYQLVGDTKECSFVLSTSFSTSPVKISAAPMSAFPFCLTCPSSKIGRASCRERV